LRCNTVDPHLHFYASVSGIYRLRKFYMYRKKL